MKKKDELELEEKTKKIQRSFLIDQRSVLIDQNKQCHKRGKRKRQLSAEDRPAYHLVIFTLSRKFLFG